MRVGIIGAGPGDIALGILLHRAGFHDFTIFDREDGVGGTWRINTYPGLACDVKSHLYSYSFALNPRWSRLWSGQREILRYFERCVADQGLRPHLRLNTDIRSATWDAASRRWRVATAAGESHEFDVVVSAVGLFTQPVLPDLVEQESFAGTVMHSSRWDHSVSLAGKRVAVLGTGSTASQVVPEDGAHAYLGMAVPGFPNFFMLYGPNTNVGSNSVIFVLEAQARYIVRALRYLRRKRKNYVAVRPSAMAQFLVKIEEWMQGTVWTTQCSNYFRAANGRVVTQWPRSARAFWAMTSRFKPADFTFEPL